MKKRKHSINIEEMVTVKKDNNSVQYDGTNIKDEDIGIETIIDRLQKNNKSDEKIDIEIGSIKKMLEKKDKYENSPVHVMINLGDACSYIKDNKEIMERDFRRERVHTGEKTYDYSRKSLKRAQRSILKKYYNTKKMSEKEIKNVKKLIKKNIDVGVYNVLKAYDNDKEFLKSKKAMEYVKIMLRPYKMKNNETKAQYNQRIAEKRRKELEAAGIKIGYNLSNYKNANLLDRINVIRNALKAQKNMNARIKGMTLLQKINKRHVKNDSIFDKISIDRKEKIKLSKIKQREKQEKKKRQLKLSKKYPKLIQTRKEMKAKEIKEKINNAVSKNKRKLAIAGCITLTSVVGITGLKLLNGIGDKVLANSSEKNILTDASKETDSLKDLKMSKINDKIKVIATANRDDQEVAKNLTIEPIEEIKEEQNQEIQQENIQSVDTENQNNFAIGSEVSIPSATIYEVADGSGKSANLENLEGKINYMAAVDLDGGHFTTYKDELDDLEKVKAENPDAEILAVHVENKGWNIVEGQQYVQQDNENER